MKAIKATYAPCPTCKFPAVGCEAYNHLLSIVAAWQAECDLRVAEAKAQVPVAKW